MRVGSRRVLLAWPMTALVMLPGCGPAAVDTSIGTTSTPVSALSTTPAPTIAAPPMPLGPETHKWVDLQVGDCIAEVPAVDLGAVAVSLVDCADAHAAEVYLRAPVEVNAAITDVANRACVDGLLRLHGPFRRGRPVRGDVSDRLQSGPDGEQSAAEHRHLPAAVHQRSTADGPRAELSWITPPRSSPAASTPSHRHPGRFPQ